MAASTRVACAASTVPADASGEEIFRAACATCHGLDGKGSPRSVVGFDLPLPNGHAFPDFTDCATNTVEPLGDWVAVASRGGPVRALDRHMPAFGEALSPEQIERTVKHLWTFCRDAAWPRGDLNFPRAFFTEKPFPENEAVVTNSEFVYEHRIGARGQWEVKAPFTRHGVGDVEVALRRTLFVSHEHGRIVAAGGAVVLPTGDERRGLGHGYAVIEPFAMWGQALGQNGFLQVHGGVELPTDRVAGQNEGFLRTALGYTVSQDQGFGRAWSPMTEVLIAKPAGSATEWDVVPQVQVSLSRLQHVLVGVGVRVPLNERQERQPEVLAYVLWDWFDGGLFRFWK